MMMKSNTKYSVYFIRLREISLWQMHASGRHIAFKKNEYMNSNNIDSAFFKRTTDVLDIQTES